MDIGERTTEQGLLLELDGRLDAEAAPELDRRLEAAVKAGIKRVVVDLGGVNYLSAAGLAAVVAGAKRLAAAEGRLALSRPNDYAREILDATGYGAVLTITASQEEAWGRLS